MRGFLTCVLFLVCLWTPSRLWADPPEVFDKRPYAEAKKAAEDGKKWFIVKATAVWCAPCKQMDKTTWLDEKVVAWVKKNGVAVQLDVDKEQKIAEELKIQAMPTMIAFKDGKEFDRIVGYKAPADFMTWLEGIARGEKSIEGVKKRATPKEGEKQNIRARMDLARSLADDGKAEEAATEYVWLWENMLDHEPAMYGVRLSFMASDMEKLASSSKTARTKFTELRDAAGKAMAQPKVTLDEAVDWVVLNRVLSDGQATLKWYDKVKDDPRWKQHVSRVSRDLSDLFVESRRWADLGRLYADPIEELERDHSIRRGTPKTPLPDGLDEETRRHVEDIPAKLFRDKAARMYAGLLAAGREEDAQKLAVRASELEKSGRTLEALVQMALDAGQPRQDQIKLIEGSKDPSVPLAPLKKRVEDALKKKDPK